MDIPMKGSLSAAVIVAAVLLVSCSQSRFDRQHSAALAKNPDGIQMLIRTRDGKQKFAPSETVELEELFTSKYRGYWRIEVNDQWSQAGSSDTAYIWDGKSVVTEPRVFRFSCCQSRLVGLDLEPVRIPYAYSAVPMMPNDAFRKITAPSTPGTYRLYLTTWRVFYKDENNNGRGRQVTSSNILPIEVTK